jgi:heme/copper-type cytochrome/quinol oxidase subunit 3
MNQPADIPRDSSTGRKPDALDAGLFGMVLFLIALSMIFAATLFGYFYIRSGTPAWPPAGSPPLPRSLWLSTVLIVLVSVAIQWAQRSVRRDRQAPLRAALIATALLATAFLVNQTLNWQAVKAAVIPPDSPALRFTSTFYILTGTHALHVLGGLILLAIVTYKAFRGAYSSARHPGIRYSAMYWHFLDAVWLILFALLMLT